MTVKLYGTSPKSPLEIEPIDYKSFTFSAGEIQVRLPDMSGFDSLIIESKYPSSQDLMEIFLVYNALHHPSLSFEGSVTLFLPYLPYSRQDRVCYRGEAFSLSVLAQLIATRSRGKDRIVTWDVHSDVAETVFKQQGVNFTSVSVEDLLERFLRKKGVNFGPETIVVAPDKGAKLRASLAARAIGSREVYYVEKERNPDDGSITSIRFNPIIKGPSPFEGRHVLIVDDICDGGRTFIELAKEIRKGHPASITLYVTHGIFSRGFEVFCDNGELLIDHILSPNLFPGRKSTYELTITPGSPYVKSLKTPIVTTLH